jgi:hypothetical protein
VKRDELPPRTVHDGVIAMFGFGKKRLDERTVGMISIELAMFMRWIESDRQRMLLPNEVTDIAKKIFKREHLSFSEKDLFHVATLAMASDPAKIDAFRKQTGFDSAIEGFCKSIGIPTP